MKNPRPNLWKYSTLVLASALAFSWGGGALSMAQAAGGKRLSAALASLQASKKHLDDAKDPPAPFHNQSVAAVTKAIDAVEREIKALEDRGTKGKDREKDRDHEKGEKAEKSSKSSKSPSKKSSSDDSNE